ncbi:hypothetical protein ESZ50_02485 [Weissella muntiaci]|uniref:Tetratricopeptide repeat protein n=1 Tax=Weissella muntiaci TaxID=2508881 RepID=A0A6C2CAF9_9LACO|nr:hypothetical protein [Weissella muntiaci]TYC50556.1 hypothetical protein ESZ50_02485 [Weissella muntiaci]
MGKRILQTIMSYESAEYFSNKVNKMPYSGMFMMVQNITSLSSYVSMDVETNDNTVVLVNLFEVSDLRDDILISFDKIRSKSDRLAIISDVEKLESFGDNLVDFSSLVTDVFIVTDQGIQFEKILNQLNKPVANQNKSAVLDILKKRYVDKKDEPKKLLETKSSENLLKAEIESSRAPSASSPENSELTKNETVKQKNPIELAPKKEPSKEPSKKRSPRIKKLQPTVVKQQFFLSKRLFTWVIGLVAILIIALLLINRKPSEQTLINQGRYDEAIGYYHDANKIEDLVMQDSSKNNKRQILLQNKRLNESKYYNLDLAFLNQDYDKVIALVPKMNLDDAGNTRLQYIGYSYMKKSNLAKAELYAEKLNNSKLKEMIKDRQNAYTQLNKIEQGLNGSPSDEQRKVLEDYKGKIQDALAKQ